MTRLTKEQKNYVKLIPIVFCEGANALKCLFSRCLQDNGQTYETFLNDFLDDETISELKSNPRQKEILEEVDRRCECEYDITILIKFIKCIHEIDEFKNWDGWMRGGTDLFKVCNNIKDLRNYVGHYPDQSITTEEFNVCVVEMKCFVTQLGADTSGIDAWKNMEFGYSWTPVSKAFLDFLRSEKDIGNLQRKKHSIRGTKMTDQAKINVHDENTDSFLEVENVDMSGSSAINFSFGKASTTSMSGTKQIRVGGAYGSTSFTSVESGFDEGGQLSFDEVHGESAFADTKGKPKFYPKSDRYATSAFTTRKSGKPTSISDRRGDERPTSLSSVADSTFRDATRQSIEEAQGKSACAAARGKSDMKGKPKSCAQPIIEPTSIPETRVDDVPTSLTSVPDSTYTDRTRPSIEEDQDDSGLEGGSKFWADDALQDGQAGTLSAQANLDVESDIDESDEPERPQEKPSSGEEDPFSEWRKSVK